MRWNSGLLWVLVCLVSLPLLNAPPSADIGSWNDWVAHADSAGLVRGFADNTDSYPPLAAAVIVTAVRTGRRAGVGTEMSIKLSALLFLVATTCVFWLWTRHKWLTLALYASLLLSSVGMAYVDIYFAPSLLLALWALRERRLALFAVAYSVSCLTKFQPLIVGPVLCVYLIQAERAHGSWRAAAETLALRVALPAAAVILPILMLYGARPIWTALLFSTGHPWLSANALNVDWILTHALHVFLPGRFGGLEHGAATLIFADPRSFMLLLPKALFGVVYIAVLLAFGRRARTFEGLVLFALVAYLTYAMLCPGVHENHLFLAGILGLVLAWLDARYLVTGLILALMANINLALFSPIVGAPSPAGRVLGGVLDSALLFSIFNVGVFLLLVRAALNDRSADGANAGARPPSMTRPSNEGRQV
jgi:hypothetical protein